MKMDGVTPENLRSKIHVRSKTSTMANHPVDTIKVLSNCLRLGGGAKVNWTGYGNLLHISVPYGDNRTWMVKSKDHRYQSPCTITSYIIGIENFIPNVGYLMVDTTYQQTYVPFDWAYIETPQRSGYALTCPGGHADYIVGSYGRLLTRMEPWYNLGGDHSAYIYSRDCYWNSPGYTRAYSIAIRAVN
jgi:hypothetical protein